MDKRSARYGHACMSCFKAKTRCIPRGDGDDACERCHRLKKRCAPTNSVRRRVLDHKQDSDSRIARLENLVSLLRAQNSGGGSDPILQLLQGDAPSLSGPAERSGGPGVLTDPSLSASASGALQPPESSAAACLETFRSQMLPHLPFLHLPSDVSAQQLQHDRPILLHAIVCVASPTAREKRALAVKLKKDICAKVFLQHDPQQQPGSAEQKVDLLLALLVYVAWGWDQPALGHLTMLAISLVGELRLDKPAPPEVLALRLLDPAEPLDEHLPIQRSLECQRTLLTVFVLSSAASAHLGQTDALRWTPLMDRALAVVGASTECPTDAPFALQVRLQLIASKAIHLRDHGRQPGQDTPEALLVQLQELQPVAEQHGGTLLAHYHSTTLTIHEALHAHPEPQVSACPPPSARPSNPTITSPLDPWQSLLAIQTCTSTLLSLPPSEFKAVSLIQWTQLTRCMAVLHQLETLRFPDPRWEPAAVRAVVDLPDLLDRLAGKLERTARDVGEGEDGGNEGVFTRLAKGVRAFREGVVLGREQQEGFGTQGVGPGEEVDGKGGGGVLVPQKGYFVNPRFWLNHLFARVEEE